MRPDSDVPLVSVIVPVYKVEKYLRQCINSVQTQSYADWEMILVDDGSPDNCGSICDEYSADDSRIKVIHQKNAGVAAARNTGINAAIGKYLYFVDADDFLNDNALEHLVDTARHFDWPDYIKGNHEVITPDDERVLTQYTPPLRQLFDNQVLSGEVFLASVIMMHPVVWNSLISREFVERHSIRFVRGASLLEDMMFHLSMIGKDFKSIYTSTPTYVYRVAVSGSLSNGLTVKFVRNYPGILHQIKKAIPNCTEVEMLSVVKKEQSRIVGEIIGFLPRLQRGVRNELISQLYKELQGTDVRLQSLIVRFLYRLMMTSDKLFKAAVNIIALLIPDSKRIMQ